MTTSISRCEQVVIVAGGMGTRLAAATGGLPKALVPVAGPVPPPNIVVTPLLSDS